MFCVFFDEFCVQVQKNMKKKPKWKETQVSMTIVTVGRDIDQSKFSTL